MRAVIVVGLCLVMGLEMMAQSGGVLTGRDAKVFTQTIEYMDSTVLDSLMGWYDREYWDWGESVWEWELKLKSEPEMIKPDNIYRSGQGRRMFDGKVISVENRTFRDSLRQ